MCLCTSCYVSSLICGQYSSIDLYKETELLQLYSTIDKILIFNILYLFSIWNKDIIMYKSFQLLAYREE